MSVRRLALVVWLVARTAAADEPIVVSSSDAGFRAALAEALAPAGLVVTVVDDPAPENIANIASASRTIADRESATATVWLVTGADGVTLVAYDRGVDRVLIRSLSYGEQLTPAQAAEAARMARTMLRALRVTPDTDQQPPSAREAPVVRATATRPAVQVPPAPSVLAIDVDGGARVLGPGATVAPSAALAVIWRPDGLGVAIAVRLAPASAVRETGFDGRITDQSVALLARLPIRIAGRLAIAGTAGLALHRLALDGDLVDEPVTDRRFDLAIRAGTALTYAVRETIGVGLAASADGLLERPSYMSGPEPVLVVPRLQLSFGIVVTARIL
jgi:hypothetical protein